MLSSMLVLNKQNLRKFYSNISQTFLIICLYLSIFLKPGKVQKTLILLKKEENSF